MSHSVDWDVEARRKLAVFWLQFPTLRQEITQASAKVDRLLVVDPWANGKLVSEGLYAINVPPLRAVFELSESDQSVLVVGLSLLT